MLSIEQTMEFLTSQMSNMDETYTHPFPPVTEEEEDRYFSENPRQYFGHVCKEHLKNNIEKYDKANLLGQNISLSDMADVLVNSAIKHSKNGTEFAIMLLTPTKHIGSQIQEGKHEQLKCPVGFYKLVAKSLHEKAHLLTRGYNCWEQAFVATKMPIAQALEKAQTDESKLSCTQKAINYCIAAGIHFFTGCKIPNIEKTSEKTLSSNM